MSIDQRNALDDEPFEYTVRKDNKIEIHWNKRPVMFVKGKQAEDLLKKLSRVEGKDVQLLLAKITGNFKCGNEKLAKGEAKKRT